MVDLNVELSCLHYGSCYHTVNTREIGVPKSAINNQVGACHLGLAHLSTQGPSSQGYTSRRWSSTRFYHSQYAAYNLSFLVFFVELFRWVSVAFNTSMTNTNTHTLTLATLQRR